MWLGLDLGSKLPFTHMYCMYEVHMYANRSIYVVYFV